MRSLDTLMPYVALYDSKGSLVSEMMTDFSYKFSEEEDDVCEFQIQTDDRKIADKPEWQEGQKLRVSWGYLNGVMSTERVIFIFETRCQYTETGVNLSITCHEKFALAKMDAVSNKTLSKLRKDTPILFSPQVLSNIKLETEKGNPKLDSLLKANKINIDGVAGSKDEDTIVSYYQGNLSTFQSLRMFLDKMEGGPYIIDSRDEGVTIRTRDFAQQSVYTYTYGIEGNGLLAFDAETKNRSKGSGAEAQTVVAWDKRNKTGVAQKTDGTEDTGATLAGGKSMGDWNDIASEKTLPPKGFESKFKESELHKRFGITSKNRVLNTDKGTKEDYDGKVILDSGFNGAGQRIMKFYKGTDYGTRQGRGGDLAVDNVAVFKRQFEIITDEPLPSKTKISAETPKKAISKANNDRKDSELKMNPATLRVEGNPLLEPGKLVFIKGVANKHEGNYYIIECTHKISDAGFITDASKMGRQGVNVSAYVRKKKKGKKRGKDRPINYSQAPTDNGRVKTKKIEAKNSNRS
jgi:hypothetical protein